MKAPASDLVEHQLQVKEHVAVGNTVARVAYNQEHNLVGELVNTRVSA